MWNVLALQLVPIASSSRKITNWPNYHFCPILLQLLWSFSFLHASHVWHLVTCQLRVSREFQLWVAYWLHTLNQFITLSHTQPLHYSHINTRFLHVELQENLARNKANTWLNKFNLTVGNRVTIQLTSYVKNPIHRLLTILKFSVNTWIETTDLVWNSHQSRLLHQVLCFLGIFIRSTCA